MAVTYYEIIVKGDDKLLKGFIKGLEIAYSAEGAVWIAEDHPVDKKHSKAARRFRADYRRLICAARFRPGLAAAVAKAADLGFEIVSGEKIARTSFEFEFETVSRAAASRIRKLLERAPAGITLHGYAPQETVEAKGRGVELYTPVHDYRFRGKGKAEGPFEALLSFHKSLAENEFLEVKDIVIEL